MIPKILQIGGQSIFVDGEYCLDKTLLSKKAGSTHRDFCLLVHFNMQRSDVQKSPPLFGQNTEIILLYCTVWSEY